MGNTKAGWIPACAGSALLAAALALPGAGLAQDAVPAFTGLPLEGAPLAVAGPYEVVQEAAGPRHTLFRPADLSAFPRDDTLPVVLWGNGGCAAEAPVYYDFLETIASHGFLVVTTAQPPDGPDEATTEHLMAGLDGALTEAERDGSALQGHVDTDHVALMGQSCGGIMALRNARDPRIDTVAAWNASIEPGFFRLRRFLEPLRNPALLIDGGDSDIPVIRRGTRASFDAIDGAPVFYGALENGGHLGTIGHPGGGAYANIAVDWLNWTLKGDDAAGAAFFGPDCRLCADPAWHVQRKGF